MNTPVPEKISSYLDWSDKGRSTFVRYAIGLVIIFLAWFILGSLVAIPFIVFAQIAFAGSVVGKTFGTVSAFLLAFVTVPLVTKFLMKRPWWSFGFPQWRIDYWAFGVAVAVSFVVSIVMTLVLGAMGLVQLKFQVPDIGQYLLLIVVAAVGLFIQTSTEEFMFRGYLTQFVRRYFSSPVVFLLIPAVLFALPHIANIAAFGGQWYAMLPYLISGLLFGWFAYRTGALWMAIGLHWANNLGNSILIGTDVDVLPSLAPIIIHNPSLEVVTGVTLVSSLFIFFILEVLIRKRAKPGNY